MTHPELNLSVIKLDALLILFLVLPSPFIFMVFNKSPCSNFKLIIVLRYKCYSLKWDTAFFGLIVWVNIPVHFIFHVFNNLNKHLSAQLSCSNLPSFTCTAMVLSIVAFYHLGSKPILFFLLFLLSSRIV